MVRGDGRAVKPLPVLHHAPLELGVQCRVDLRRVGADQEIALVGSHGHAFQRDELDQPLEDLRPGIGVDAGLLDQFAPRSFGIAFTRIDRTASETRVTVTARSLLRDLTLHPDRLHPDAQIDRAGLTMLPGESVVFTVTGVLGLDPAALTTRPVLRCVNDIT